MEKVRGLALACGLGLGDVEGIMMMTWVTCIELNPSPSIDNGPQEHHYVIACHSLIAKSCISFFAMSIDVFWADLK